MSAISVKEHHHVNLTRRDFLKNGGQGSPLGLGSLLLPTHQKTSSSATATTSSPRSYASGGSVSGSIHEEGGGGGGDGGGGDGGGGDGGGGDGGGGDGGGGDGGGGDGGGGGSEGDGGGDGDEPPINAITQLQPEWWQLSILIALIVTVAVFLILLVLCKPNRFYIPALIASFLGTCGMLLYLNPAFWYRRMSELAIASLVGSNIIGGLLLSIPLPWSPIPFVCKIPESHWSMNLVLGVMAVTFAGMQLAINQQRKIT